jgi:predicted nucleic acid-binding protein
MRIVVNDTSALIDLKKGGLLKVFLELPFELVVSDDIVADELLSFTKAEISLMRRKMTIAALDSSELAQVAALQRKVLSLSLHDCASFVIAQRETGCILLTGDRRLRAKAEQAKIECHGILWAIEEIAKARLATSKKLLKALELWRNDRLVRLPVQELERTIVNLKK